MKIDALFTALSAMMCLQVGVVFAWLYAKMSKREADLRFSLLSLSLFAMLVGEFFFVVVESPSALLFWFREQHFWAFLATVTFLHFVSVVLERPLTRTQLRWLYGIGAGSMIACWLPSYAHLPADSWTPAVSSFPYASVGPLIWVFLGMMIVAISAWLKWLIGLLNNYQPGAGPLGANATFIFVSVLFIILSGFAKFYAFMRCPHYVFPVGPASLFVLLFALCAALSLGRETLLIWQDRERLAKTVAIRDEAVRDVAHELRNPLTAVQMATSMMLDYLTAEQAELRSFVSHAVSTCARLNRLINNMLDTARLEAGHRLDLREHATSLPRLVNEVLEFYRLDLSKRQLELPHPLVFRDELPPGPVRLDGDKVYQVLYNLVDNAVKYSPEGGDVVVKAWLEGSWLCLSVSDHGLGIPAEKQRWLFERYQRLVAVDRRITGTGIGLHMVKALVAAHGGEIGVDSRPGEGSTFTVRLPYRAAELAEAA